MNYEMIIDELNTWQSDECLFRDYAAMLNGQFSRESFFKQYQSDSVNLTFALHPETINAYMPENKFISVGQNVSIVKHPRYIPLFFHEHAFFEIIYVLSGTCMQHFHEKKLRLRKGDLCLLAPNVKHAFYPRTQIKSIIQEVLLSKKLCENAVSQRFLKKILE